MRKQTVALVSALIGVFGLVGVSHAATWPNVTGTDIGGGLASAYEPSGNTIYNSKIYVVTDEGEITRLTTNGTVEYQTATQSTTLRSQSTALGLGSDLESISTGNDSYLYLGYEVTNMMAQFDPSSMTLTGKTWSFNSVLSPIIGTDTSNGMEALTITPNYVITGLQHNGRLYYFSVNFSVSGSTPTYIGTVNVATLTGDSTLASDNSDVYYSSDSQKVYALYDSANKIVELNEAGTVYYSNFSLPSGEQQEGVTVISSCATSSTATTYISEDTNGVDHQVWVYAGYPVTCPAVVPTIIDADADGVVSTADCNDSDATVSTNQTYYRDADGDGLGLLTSTSIICASTALSGYVSNSSDQNDTDFDNDGVSTSLDCNDLSSAISANVTYYRDADGDGLGILTSISVVCSSTAPTGYVANSLDSNDVDYDNDGSLTSVDCDDHNSAVTIGYTYYLDADGDGLGSTTTITSCSATPTSGYATNHSDLNDADFDNDSVSTSADCNDADATIWTTNTFYQDLDADGMGSSQSTSVCSTSAPSGYVMNINESSDANDLISNAGVEISGDGRDNDGDGKIDEYNTVGENGLHPYFSKLSPTSSSVAATALLSWSGLSNGYIRVKYVDGSVYRYRIFNTNTSRITKIKQLNSTANFQVTSSNNQVMKVNGYTGVSRSMSKIKAK